MGRKSEFSREEKIAAVKLVTEGGRSLLSVANEYGIHENTLGKWKRQYAINPEDAFKGEPVADAANAQERELQQLKRRIRELEEENSFQKKYRHTLQRTRSEVCCHRGSCGGSQCPEGLRAARCASSGELRVPGAQGQHAEGSGQSA